MYGLQRRLNNDKAHVDLQKQFLQQSSATTKLSDTQIRLCVFKVCQIIKCASAYFHTYHNLSDQCIHCYSCRSVSQSPDSCSWCMDLKPKHVEMKLLAVNRSVFTFPCAQVFQIHARLALIR